MKKDALSSTQCALLLKALADEDRLRIIHLLRAGPHAVSDLASTLSVEVANVSHHLGVLRRAGLVITKRQGKQIIYELPTHILQDAAGNRQHLNLGCCRLEIPKG